MINKCYEELSRENKAVAFTEEEGSPTSQATPRTEETRETYSKLDDMLRKQKINFIAFSRAAENIQVESFRDRWEFEDALQVLQTRWAVVDKAHWDIMVELEEANAYEAHYSKHERTYNALRRAINSGMWSASYRDKSTPKMEIPTFSGLIHQWISFKDLFNEAIDKNPALSNAQRMQVLKSKVKGEAERLIQHLPISSSNYGTCWEILNHRFDNKKQIFTAHVSTFYNLANIQQQSYASIKRLHDVTLESLHAIKNLGVDITTWDPLLVYILAQKLDNDSYSDYIESLKNSRELPVLQEFLNFSENKFMTLESSRRRQDASTKSASAQQHTSSSNFQHRNNNYHKPNSEYKYTKRHEVALHVSESASKCPHCSALHNIKDLNYCVNFIYDHKVVKCYSTKRCRKCNSNHHTSLHDCFATQSLPKYTSNIAKQNIDSNYQANYSNGGHTSQQETSSEILLATALVKVTAADNTKHVMRALIDQGSQVSVISQKAAQQLGLKRKPCRGVVVGVGERENNCKGTLTITCQSTHNDYKFTTEAFIMNNLIKDLPNQTFSKSTWKHTQHILLADPDYNISRPVDLLLGAEVYSNILLEGLMRGQDPSEPLAQHTQLGWLLCGGNVKTTFQCNVIMNNIEFIHQFWKIEDIQEQNEMSVEDQECLNLYEATTKRLENGRYEVRLPM